jgi:hypothetical protein
MCLSQKEPANASPIYYSRNARTSTVSVTIQGALADVLQEVITQNSSQCDYFHLR